MQEGILTVNIETGLYEIFLTKFSERMALFNGDDFLIMIDGHWKNTKIVFSDTENDWLLEGVDIKDWGIGSLIKVDLQFEE